MVNYRIEHSKSGRATCQGQCKAAIEHDALRCCTITEVNDSERTFYRHFPKCVTATVAKNIIQRYGSPDKVPGLRDLDPEDRKRATQALSDLANNKAVKGYEEDDDEEEAEDDSEEEEDEEEEEDDDDQPAAKRGRHNNVSDEGRARQAAGGKKGNAVKKAKAEGREYREGEEYELYGGVGERKGQQNGGRQQQGQQGHNNVSAEGRAKQAMGGKKGAAIRKAKSEGREYREGEEYDLYGGVEQGDDGNDGEDDEYKEEQGKGQGQGGRKRGSNQPDHHNVSADGRSRQAAGGKKGAAVRQAKAEGREYREGEEFERYGPVGQKRRGEAHDHNNVSAEGRAKQAMGGKKGAAVRQAKAEGREYREGEEFERYGGVGQYKGGNKDDEDDDYEEGDESEEDGENDDGGQQNGGGQHRHNNVSAEGRARQAAGGKKGQAVRRAKEQGREYHEGEEYDMYGPVGEKRGRTSGGGGAGSRGGNDGGGQGGQNGQAGQANGNRGGGGPSRGGHYYDGPDPLRQHLSKIGRKGGKNSHGGRGKAGGDDDDE